MAGHEEDVSAKQIDLTIEEFNRRAQQQPDLNAVLDASQNDDVRHANIYRDYISKQSVVRNLDPRRTDIVLDFGCGVGRISNYLSSRVGRVEAIDRAEEMIIAALKKRSANVHFQHMLTHDLPFETGIFDKAFTYGVLQHINDQELKYVLNELYRVLKPGGKLICLEMTRKSTTWFGQVAVHRTVSAYETLFKGAEFQVMEIRNVIRHPSYAMGIWNRFRYLPRAVLPLLAEVESQTLTRKPEFVEYYVTVFILRK
jgi:ubiquinone/menaquinone biosynthesis C-methylase UbiE